MTTETLQTNLADRLWRLNNLYRIQPKEGPEIQFRVNPAQERLLEELHYKMCILKARQLGFSTLIAIYILDALLFNAELKAGLIDRTETDAKEKLGKMRYAYERLPEALRKHIRKGETWSTEKISWSNGSEAVAGVSLRGGTYQYLHVSEYGKIAFKDPKRAKEIKTGSFNTVPRNGFIFVESTHEGGKGGYFYELSKAAMERQGEELTEMDFKHHFEPWYRDPSYVLDPSNITIPDKLTAYFDNLEADNETEITPEQRAWYFKKQQEQGDDMQKEFPSTEEEAFNVVIEGAIYGDKISAIRAKGQICDFEFDRTRPVHTFWDIGFSDTTDIWAIQLIGREVHWINFFEDNGQPCSHYVRQLKKWEDEGYIFNGHFLPHDADATEKGSGKTYRQQLEDAGLRNITVVPRTPDRWIGINHLRSMYPRFWFHKTNCKRGLECAEAYRKQWNERLGRFGDDPLHDWSSNAADAKRTFAEAHLRGLIKDNSSTARESRRGNNQGRVLTGLRR